LELGLENLLIAGLLYSIMSFLVKVRRDSGVGAGIDSYYEYCLKAYILLGDEKYLTRFNRHYNAVMKYVSQGPLLVDVHMHRPHTNSKNFMDALLAFWPGLQVLA